jgi:hypothetical protein
VVLGLKTKIEWRWGKDRWMFWGFLCLSVIASSVFVPIRPEIRYLPKLYATPIDQRPGIGDFYQPNNRLPVAGRFVGGDHRSGGQIGVRRDNMVQWIYAL